MICSPELAVLSLEVTQVERRDFRSNRVTGCAAPGIPSRAWGPHAQPVTRFIRLAGTLALQDRGSQARRWRANVPVSRAFSTVRHKATGPSAGSPGGGSPSTKTDESRRAYHNCPMRNRSPAFRAFRLRAAASSGSHCSRYRICVENRSAVEKCAFRTPARDVSSILWPLS